MAIPRPEPSDWSRANARELQASDREVLEMLRETYKSVNAQLQDLVARDSPLISAGIKRAQLEQTRSRLLAEQSKLFERLGDKVSARRARAASRAQRLSAAGDAALLSVVGKGPQGQFLYASALETSQRAIDTALARMRLSAVPLSERIYRTGVWMNGRLGKLINETLASGLNAREFATKARDWFNPNTPGGVRYAAMRLARTEINNAFHAMSAQKAAETPWVNQVEWNLSGSHPKRDICNDRADDSPYASDNVPVRPHPQCMCFITPKSIDEDEFIDNFLKGDYDEYLDGELEKNGWQVSEPESKPVKVVAEKTEPNRQEKVTATSRMPGATGEVVNSTLKQAGLGLGDEFIYHGQGGKIADYISKGIRVFIRQNPSFPNQKNAWVLEDSSTGQRVAQAGSPLTKWWIEKIPVATRELTAKPAPLTGDEAQAIVPKGLFKQGTLTPAQKKSLETYETGWFMVINSFLRGKTSREDVDNRDLNIIENIDSAMRESVLPKPIQTWRGMFRSKLLFGDSLDHDLTGFSWLEKGYGSTTTQEKVVETFNLSDDRQDPKYARQNVKMKINIAAGVQALQTSTSSKGSAANGPQAEITLQRDLVWKVVKDNGYDAAGVRQIEVEVDIQS